MIDLASKYDFIKGIVGWVDLRSENIEKVLEKYSKQNIVKGFRHVVQAESDHNFLLRPSFLRGISLLEKYNFTYDILVFPHQLGAVLEFVKQFPKQKQFFAKIFFHQIFRNFLQKKQHLSKNFVKV